jgi:hypothetical protein
MSSCEGIKQAASDHSNYLQAPRAHIVRAKDGGSTFKTLYIKHQTTLCPPKAEYEKSRLALIY